MILKQECFPDGKLKNRGVFCDKKFNTTAVCVPDKHYMVDLSERVKEIKKLVSGKLNNFPELKSSLCKVLMEGEKLSWDPDQ